MFFILTNINYML